MDLSKNFTFIKTAKSWDQIFKTLSQINKLDELQAGKLFELFCKHYFIVKNEFKSVKLLSEADLTVLKKLNIESKDHGCDLVLITNDNKFAAVQCKFTNNQDDKTLNWTGDRLSSFLAASTKTDIRIIFTNASGVSPAVIRKANEKNYIQYDFQHLNELSESEIKAIYSSVQGAKIQKVFYKPKPHQKKAISKVVSSFKTSPRGKLILPCGAGKTLTALWIKERVKSNKTLVLVPSLSLLRQFKRDWIAQEKIKSSYFCVCSENDIASSDSPEIGIHEIGGMVTTKPIEIRQWLKNNNDQIVYATYQSSPRIAEAMKRTNLKFDLVICDEAHRTSGERSSAFATILDDNKIKASKRLFMTATPRIVSEKIKDKLGNESYKYLADMNDEALYGKEFFYMNFGDAIKKKPAFLTDYKIIAVGVTDEEVASWLKNRRFANGTSINDIAHNYALEKVMTKYKANHAITFHSRVSAAKEFQERHTEMYKNTESFHVNGAQSSSNRAHDLNKFKDAKSAVITNARCLTEGVDVPAIDMVYFCDSRSSKIDIVQATGRALRVYSGKKLGYIVVPIFHNKKTSSEIAIEDGNYKVLIQVVRAMADQDARIEEEINSIKYGVGERNISSSKIQIESGSKSRIELLGFEEKLKKSIFTNVVSRSVVKWRPFLQAKDFIKSQNIKSQQQWYEYCKKSKPIDIPRNPQNVYKNEWVNWGDWLGTGNISNSKRSKHFYSFIEAREFVRSLRLKSRTEWGLYCQNKLTGYEIKPSVIPSNPDKVYPSSWCGMGDWLGTGRIATFEKEYLSFKNARDFARQLGLKSGKEWNLYVSGKLNSFPKLPSNIPKAPQGVYADSWKGWSDWLGSNFKRGGWQSFAKSRKFVRTLKLKSRNEWHKYCKGNLKNLPKKPVNIPNNPNEVYKEWVSMGDWLGSGVIASQHMKFKSFSEAKKFSQSLGLKSYTEWRLYSSGKLKNMPKKPNNIPGSPPKRYKNDWRGWPDWLGTNTKSSRHKWPTFEKARDQAIVLAKKYDLKNQKDWNQFVKDPKFNFDIPKAPKQVYKNKGFKGYYHWLGSDSDRFFSLNEAINIVKNKNLNSRSEYIIWAKKYNNSISKREKKLPLKPEYNKGWVSWLEFLNNHWLKYEEAKVLAQRTGAKSQTEWRLICKNKKIPMGVPHNPNTVYKNKGWSSWGDWLNTGRPSPGAIKYWDFEKVKSFVIKLKLNSWIEWVKYTKGEFKTLPLKPKEIPNNPRLTYKKDGWISVSNFLGKQNNRGSWRNFSDAKKFVKNLDLKSKGQWYEYTKGKIQTKTPIPDDIPKDPPSSYKEYWVSWPDWLGKI